MRPFCLNARCSAYQSISSSSSSLLKLSFRGREARYNVRRTTATSVVIVAAHLRGAPPNSSSSAPFTYEIRAKHSLRRAHFITQKMVEANNKNNAHRNLVCTEMYAVKKDFTRQLWNVRRMSARINLRIRYTQSAYKRKANASELADP